MQIQSNWFPLYDHCPQNYVADIFRARPGDCVKATQRIYHKPQAMSEISLPLAPAILPSPNGNAS